MNGFLRILRAWFEGLARPVQSDLEGRLVHARFWNRVNLAIQAQQFTVAEAVRARAIALGWQRLSLQGIVEPREGLQSALDEIALMGRGRCPIDFPKSWLSPGGHHD